ncbi:hypothetical protein FA15DRAFT_653765 [Coprinopsis marcescibilis]|uniref:Uncharacterized protein n=1 Tax=Coprinopsis marcescibilis TaxID=230819 RepID=A0A5C3L3V0_COPMA|nr:hypothetical protein FA15DRAFT_653765 [Coprinopsis marcescibilis]
MSRVGRWIYSKSTIQVVVWRRTPESVGSATGNSNSLEGVLEGSLREADPAPEIVANYGNAGNLARKQSIQSPLGNHYSVTVAGGGVLAQDKLQRGMDVSVEQRGLRSKHIFVVLGIFGAGIKSNDGFLVLEDSVLRGNIIFWRRQCNSEQILYPRGSLHNFGPRVYLTSSFAFAHPRWLLRRTFLASSLTAEADFGDVPYIPLGKEPWRYRCRKG